MMAAANLLSESQENSMYMSQLKEVFDSCDVAGKQRLGRNELLTLCEKLQLEDQSEYLVDELLAEKGEVDFEEFHVSFVNILCRTYATNPESSDEEDDDSESEEDDDDDDDEEEDDEVMQEENPVKREVSPKYNIGKKHYGRRSLPVAIEDLDDLQVLDEEDIEVASSTKSLRRHSILADDDSDTEEDDGESRRKRRRHEKKETETFEAEGELNKMIAHPDHLTVEEEYLRGIWNNLGVGRNGYIDIHELARVCKHIDMEDMDDLQLQQLFDKLDADGDGRVSFGDFLNELFQHKTPPNQQQSSARPSSLPKSKGSTPTRALSAQKKIKFPGSDERTTPSIVQGGGVSGLFSSIDADKTGFAKPENIIDFWEKYNICNGADVLLALGVDINTKVNLSHLSAALEQELLNPDEQSLVFQAAAISYQQEIRHLKSSLEQAGWAKDKLKLDLTEANSRNSLLAKEVDERHANMEKSSHARLLSIEQKYQDQVRVLQSDLDKERESMAQLSVRHKQNLEREAEELKQEEAKLREQLLDAQKEIEKQGRELEETANKLEESVRQTQRLQRELDNTQELHRKLAVYESKGLVTPEEQQYTRDKLQRLEDENKNLKDHNDELTAELENIKQSSLGHRLGDGDVYNDRDGGSVMSDYISSIVKKGSISSVESDEDVALRASDGSRRRLTSNESDDIRKRLLRSSVHMTTVTGIGDPSEKETIEHLQRELQQSRDHFDIERREIEQAYRLEIAEIEERHDTEKAQLIQHVETEKEKLSGDFEKLQKEALSELAKELQTNFAHEKETLVQKQESEKNHLEQKHKENKEELIKRLQNEFKAKLENQSKELQSTYEKQQFDLEETLADTEPVIRQLEEEKNELEETLEKFKIQSDKDMKKQKKEMEELRTKQVQMLEDVEKQKQDAELKYRKELNDLTVKHKKEMLDLQSDIDLLGHDVRDEQNRTASLEIELRQQKEELETSFRQEKQEILQLYENKIKELEDYISETERTHENALKGGVSSLQGKLRVDFDKLVEKAVGEKLEKERTEMSKKLEKQLQTEFDTKQSELSHVFDKERTELKEKYEEQIAVLHGELELLQGKLEDEREALALRYDADKEALEEQLAQQIREELEDEFVQQMEDIRVAYEEEKQGYEAQNAVLQQEINDLHTELEKAEQQRKTLDEMKRANSKLAQEKKLAEKVQQKLAHQLEETQRSLEARIDELTAEKDGAITAVQTQMVESSKQSDEDKATLEAVIVEKESLEKKTVSLIQQLTELHSMAETNKELERKVEKLLKENEELQNRSLESAQASSIPDHIQHAINDLTKEKSILEEKHMDLQNRFDEAQEMEKKYTHLQKKYEDASKERDKVSHLAKSLKEQLNKANTAHREEHDDKLQLTNVLEEKRLLETQLQKVSDKLLEVTTTYSMSQSQHSQELAQWKEQCCNMVDLQKYTKLQIDLIDTQRSQHELNEAIKVKEETSTKALKEASEKHQEEVKSLETQKDNVTRQLNSIHQVLDGQIDKFKQQHDALERRNVLVVDLYKENAELMDSLYRVEQQKKDTIAKCYKLEDQCRTLKKMLQRVAKVAIS